MAFLLPLLEAAEIGAEAGLFGAEELGFLGVEAAETAEVGAVEMASFEEVPEVLSSDFLSVADVSVLPEAEIAQVTELEVPELIESDFLSVPDIEPIEPFEVEAEPEMVERRVDLDVIEEDFNYREMPEELENEDIFDKMRNVKGSIEDKINFLKGKYDEAFTYIENMYNQIKNTRLFKIGKVTISIGSLIEFVDYVKKTIKKGEELRDMGKEFEDWYEKKKGTTPTQQPTAPTEEGRLNYEEMTDLVKTFNNKEETIDFLARHKEEYDSLTPDQKRQLLLLAKENF